jgi:nucleoside-diphosphate-sugar epimerase
MERIALRYGAFYRSDSVTRMIVNLVRKRRLPVPSSRGGFVSFIYLKDPAPRPWPAWRRGAPGRRTTSSTTSRCAGPTIWPLAAEFGARRPWRVPTSMLRAIPYLHTIMTTSMRVSNAKARRELGWAPAVSTYRDGVPLVVKASR